MPVSHMNVPAAWRESGYVHRRAVVRLGRTEPTLREGKVVAADAKGVFGHDSGQSVPVDPLQGGVAVFEHAGRKPCVLAMEYPDLRQSYVVLGNIVAHGTKRYLAPGRQDCRGVLICRDPRARRAVAGRR